MIGSINPTASSTTVLQPAGFSNEAGALSPEEQVLALLVFSEMTRSDAAKGSISLSSEQLKELQEEARKALAAAQEAQKHSGFWGKISSLLHGDIASLAEVVAVAAAAVATGGTAAIVLGAIAIGATLASKYAEQLGIPPNVAIALGVAAGLASVASGNVGGGVSSFGEAASLTKTCAQGVEVGATAGGAVAHGVSGHYESQALDYKADAKGFENQQVLESSNIDENLDILQQALDRQLSGALSINQALQFDHQSAQAVLQDFSGAA